MDILTFITKIVEALAWPVSSVALVALLRREIRLLLPLVKKIKAGPVEAEFERGTAMLSASLPSQPKAEEALTHGLAIEADGTNPSTNPRATVLESWLHLEAAANEALGRKQAELHGPGAIATRPASRGLAEALKASGLLHEGQLNLFKELQHLRNEVVHTLEFTPTREAIVRYMEAANYLKWWLAEGTR